MGGLCGSCAANEKRCNNVCMAVSNVPESGCGTSCTPCSVRHAVATCASNGTCSYSECETGWGDCDGDATNGCETNLLENGNCGACGVSCTGTLYQCTPNGCAAGCPSPGTTCAVGGACTYLTDTANCGACGKVCALDNASASCASGTCVFLCAPGEVLCDAVDAGASPDAAASPVCVDTNEDPNNCGQCGRVCTSSAGACAGGTCVCPQGYTACGGTCVITSMDPANCGGCGVACNDASTSDVCVAGLCVPMSSLWLATGLATGTNTGPADIAVDEQNVYWSNTADNSISTVPKAGGSAMTVATGQAGPARIALDGTHVYWSNQKGNTIMRAPKDGSAVPTLVATSAYEPNQIVVIGDYVYFGDGDVERAPAAGGQSVTWCSPSSGIIPFQVSDLVTDGAGTALWTSGTGLGATIPSACECGLNSAHTFLLAQPIVAPAFL